MTQWLLSPRRGLLTAALVALLLPPLTLAPYLQSGTEVVKLRNAALLEPALGPDFGWSNPPGAGFRFDVPSADGYFVDRVLRLGLPSLADDWQRALAISRHLLGASMPLSGGPIRDDLRRTHAAITGTGVGYCADFVRVFMAFASAAGMQVRAWAFSFDGFGGDGHILVEVWNRQARRWQVLDVFNNYAFSTASGEPLSALEFRRAMASDPDSVRMSVIEPRARPGWIHRAKAVDYYRRGLDEWYLMWGSNVLAVEDSAAFRLLRPLSFQLAQAGAVVQGVYPTVRPLATPANAHLIDALKHTRRHLIGVAVAIAVGLILIVAALLIPKRASRSAGRTTHAY